MQYWFNVQTGQVIEDDQTNDKANLMGPYETHQEAAQALQSAAERTQAWDEEERREEDEA